MNEEEIREFIQQTVKATLREIFTEDLSGRLRYYSRQDALYEFGDHVNRLSLMLSDFEKKFSGPSKCLYDKEAIASIKDDTKKIL